MVTRYACENSQNLAWPDCWFKPGFRVHQPIEVVLKELRESMEQFEQRIEDDAKARKNGQPPEIRGQNEK